MLPNAEAVARLTDVAAGWLLTYIVHSTIPGSSLRIL